MSEKIISKGFYPNPNIPDFVYVGQYIVLERSEKRHLLLKFRNPKGEEVSEISFSIDFLGFSGEVIDRTDITTSSIRKSRSSFFVGDTIIMPDGASDFRVSIHSVRYGNYVYTLHGEEVHSTYVDQEEIKAPDCRRFIENLGGKTHRSFSRSLRLPHLFVALASMIIIALGVIVGLKLYDFTRTEYCFTLDKVEYTFATEDRDGPINITGYKGTARNIVIPAEIEGHKVLAVSKGAFRGSNLRSITFKGNIEIQDSAFTLCKSLETVSIMSTAQIAAHAFEDCYKLKSVTVKSGLVAIGPSAFRNCTALTEFDIPSTVSSVGDYAFANCKRLATLTIPDSVTAIGEAVLADCSSLNALCVPYIGANIDAPDTLNYLFGEQTPESLKNLTVTQMTAVGDRMFYKETYIENITFIQPITSIGNLAFCKCEALVGFSIPETVTKIGQKAFKDCVSLQSVTIPTSVTRIEESTFNNCPSLTSVNLPETLVYIGKNAFLDCSSLSALYLPKNLNYFGDGAIQGCSAITELTLPFLGNTPDSVTTMSTLYGGYSSTSLSSLTLLSGELIPDYAFSDFPALKTVSLPETISRIGAFAFARCTSLTSVNLPETITDIGSYAFSECSSLSEIAIPSKITSIADSTFSGCSSLTSIAMPTSISYIGDSAFSACSSLTGFTVPDGVTRISNSCFSGCTGLAGIVIPASVTEIGSSAFYNCSALCRFSLPSALNSIGAQAFYSCSALASIDFPASLSSIGYEAFSGCSSLSSVTVPETVSSMGSAVFSGCSSLSTITAPHPGKFSGYNSFAYYFSNYVDASGVPASLKTVNLTFCNYGTLPASSFQDFTGIEVINLPSNLSAIDSNAFKNCSSLKSLTIPSSVTRMSDGMLYGTSALEEITLPYAGYSSTSRYESESFRRFYFTNDGYGDYYSQPENLKRVVLTNATIIPESAFYGITSIEEIVYPENLTLIGSCAFQDCLGLTKITVPEKISTIGSYAFSGCYNLREIVNHSQKNLSSVFSDSYLTRYAVRTYKPGESTEGSRVTSSGYSFLLGDGSSWYLIGYDKSASTHTLPSSFASGSKAIYSYKIPSYLFYNKSGISSIYISPAVESIGDYAFAYCYGLADVTFAAGGVLSEIGNYAFYYSPIKNAILPSPLGSIGSSAFEGCSSLASVTLPTSLYNIGDYAFSGCSSLLEVYNLTPFDVKRGSSDYGYVAQNALIVHKDAYAEALHDLTVNGLNFKKSDDTWFLVSLEDGSKTDLELQSFTYNGKTVTSYEVLPYAFAYTSLKSVTVGGEVTALGDSAFSGCRSLETVIFDSDSQIRSIGHYTFSECASLKEIVLPASVSSIGDYAFYQNSNLSRAVLSASLTSIGYAAFEGCQRLYEVANPSTLYIVAGNSDYGYVAYNALAVLKSASEALEKHTISGTDYDALFANWNGTWYLLSYEQKSGYQDFAILPELTIGTASYDYVIFNNAFRFASCYSLLIPASVSAMQPSALDFLYSKTVYYGGTEEEYLSLVGNSDYYGTTYYYSECVHEYGFWRYDTDGSVTIANTELEYVVIKDATCTEVGEYKYVCGICKDDRPEWHGEIPTSSHTYKDGKCVYCGKVIITSENMEYYDCFSNDPVYPFSVDENGMFRSTNKKHTSSSTMIITAKESMLVTFMYYTSSEANCDIFTISQNNREIARDSGVNNGVAKYFEIVLEKGDTLNFTYKKDSTQNNGDDCVYIYDLTIETP